MVVYGNKVAKLCDFSKSTQQVERMKNLLIELKNADDKTSRK